MNDRFKFRFYDKLYKMYLQDGYYINGNKWMDDCYEDVSDLPENIIPEQCTGLKDNCGNLIYEGDIIGDGEDDYVIKWDSNRTMFVAEDIDTSYEIEDVLDSTICVIGNIHETAEKKEEK